MDIIYIYICIVYSNTWTFDMCVNLYLCTRFKAAHPNIKAHPFSIADSWIVLGILGHGVFDQKHVRTCPDSLAKS